MNTLTLDYKTFLKGFSKSNYFPGGGFSPDSRGWEVDRVGSSFGLLSTGRKLEASFTGIGSSNYIYSSVVAKLGSDSLGLYAIAAGGKIYYKKPAALSTTTTKHTETNRTYDANSHCIIYNGDLLITSTTDIYRDDGTFGVNDYDWWTVTRGKAALTSGVPHKQFIFQEKYHVLNGNKVASWDGTTAVDAAFTLPIGWVIVDVAINGGEVHFLATKTYGQNFARGENKIFVWNGITAITWDREIELLTETVTAIKKTISGFHFFTSSSLYFSDGYSYQFIENIEEAPNFNNVLVSKGIIYFKSYLGIKAYNTQYKILTQPIYYAVENSSVTHFNMASSDWFDIWTTENGTSRCYYSTTNGTTDIFYSDPYYFPSPVSIRRIEIVLKTKLSGTLGYTIKLYDETDLEIHTQSVEHTNSLYAGKIKATYQVNFNVNILKLSVTSMNPSNPAIKYIKVYYEPAERNTNK